MKKLLAFFAISIIHSCSSDDTIFTPCNEQVVSAYMKDQQIVSNVKNNVIIIEFDIQVSNAVISERLLNLALFDLPLNSQGQISTIYSNPLSIYFNKYVVAYFKEGMMSCDKLNEHIKQIDNFPEVLNVKKLMEGANKYQLMMETNVVQIKIQNSSELVSLQQLADNNGYILTDNDPTRFNDNEALVYYLYDESTKKSIIEFAKILSKGVKYEYIMPVYINL